MREVLKSTKNPGRIQTQINNLVTAKFEPKFLAIYNQSKMHSRGDETHYKIIIVSDKINELGRPVKQHQAIMRELKTLLAETSLHSVSVQVVPSMCKKRF